MVHEPDVALSMIAFGSLAHRKISPNFPSKPTPSRAMQSAFATNNALLKIVLYYVIYDKHYRQKYYVYYRQTYCTALKEVHFDMCDFNGSMSQKGSRPLHYNNLIHISVCLAAL